MMWDFHKVGFDGETLSHHSVFSLFFDIPRQEKPNILELDLHDEGLVVQIRGILIYFLRHSPNWGIDDEKLNAMDCLLRSLFIQRRLLDLLPEKCFS